MNENMAIDGSMRSAEHFSPWARLLKVAWLSILLGLIMEMLLIITLAYFGTMPGVKTVVADTVQKVSWGFFVCLGVAAGTVLSNMRAAVASVSGLLGAPLAFTIAQTLHKSIAAALSLAPQAAGAFTPLFLALFKGVEYAILGGAIAWIGTRSRVELAAYAGIGLMCGVFFGGALVAMAASAPSVNLPLSRLVALGVNEVIFPMGCALVLYFSKIVGARFSKDKDQPAA
jgi:hypothetical protein